MAIQKKEWMLSGSRPLRDDEAWDIGKQKGEQNWVTFLSKPFFPESPLFSTTLYKNQSYAVCNLSPCYELFHSLLSLLHGKQGRKIKFRG